MRAMSFTLNFCARTSEQNHRPYSLSRGGKSFPEKFPQTDQAMTRSVVLSPDLAWANRSVPGTSREDRQLNQIERSQRIPVGPIGKAERSVDAQA